MMMKDQYEMETTTALLVATAYRTHWTLRP